MRTIPVAGVGHCFYTISAFLCESYSVEYTVNSLLTIAHWLIPHLSGECLYISWMVDDGASMCYCPESEYP